MLDNFFNLSSRISDGDGFKILVIVSLSKRYMPALIFTAVPTGCPSNVFVCVNDAATHDPCNCEDLDVKKSRAVKTSQRRFG